MNYGRNKTAAEHAAAELHARGVWTCGCPACLTARADTKGALEVGFCGWCSAPLRGRRSRRFCCNAHRQAAYERRQARKLAHTMPLFGEQPAASPGLDQKQKDTGVTC